MLIEFSVENFLSFDERVTLSMVAAPELDETDGLIDETDGLIENTFEAPGGLRLLKSALVYGPNASGKSNLVKAVLFMRAFVLKSAKETQSGEAINVTPFLLGSTDEERGSLFEIVWSSDGYRYRYAFSVNRVRVLSEHLFRSPSDEDTETELFRRDGTGIVVGEEFLEGRDVISRTRPNSLFLSVVAQLNGEESQKILDWFRNRLGTISGLRDEKLLDYTYTQLLSGNWAEEILRLVREADLGITGISTQQISAEMLPDDLPEDLRRRILEEKVGDLKIRHQKLDHNGQPTGDVEFRLTQESEGTQKLIALAGPLLHTLKSAKTLMVDELDARLHPRLARAVINLFHADSNPLNAQLIGAVHDTNLLDKHLFRRDQIWFTDKDLRGATKLYSLAEFDVPPDARYERDYLLGKYGAVPNIGDLVARETGK